MNKKIQQKAWKSYKNKAGNDIGRVARALAKEHGVSKDEITAFLESEISRRKFLLYGAISGVVLLGAGAFGLQYLPKDKKLTADEIANLEGMDKILFQHGKTPDIIYIAQAHPHQFREFEARNIDITIDSIEKICNQLYDQYNVKSIMVEGLFQRHAELYKEKRFNYDFANQPEGKRKFFLSIQQLLNNREWNLYIGETSKNDKEIRDEEEPILKAHNEFVSSVKEDVAKAMSEAYKKTGDGTMVIAPENQVILNQRVQETLNTHFPKATAELEIILTPEKLQKLYNLIITERNSSYIKQSEICINSGNGPIIVILGSGHTKPFIEQINNRNYIAILPHGFGSMPPLETSQEIIKRGYLALPTGTSSMNLEGKFTENGFKFSN